MLLLQPPPGSLGGLLNGGGPGGNPAPPGALGGDASPGAPAPSQGMADVSNGTSIGMADHSFGRALNSTLGRVGVGLLGAVPGAQPFAMALKAAQIATAPPVQNLHTIAPMVDLPADQVAALSGSSVGPGTGDISGAVGGSTAGGQSPDNTHAGEAANATGGESSAGAAPGGPGPGDNGGDNGSGGGDNARGGIIRTVRGKAPQGSRDDGWITAQRGEAVLDRGAVNALGPSRIALLNLIGQPQSRR